MWFFDWVSMALCVEDRRSNRMLRKLPWGVSSLYVSECAPTDSAHQWSICNSCKQFINLRLWTVPGQTLFRVHSLSHPLPFLFSIPIATAPVDFKCENNLSPFFAPFIFPSRSQFTSRFCSIFTKLHYEKTIINMESICILCMQFDKVECNQRYWKCSLLIKIARERTFLLCIFAHVRAIRKSK